MAYYRQRTDIPERAPSRRLKTILIAAVIVFVLGALSAVGYYEHFVKPHF